MLHAGKQLEPTAACGLSKGDTVHLVGGLDGGAPTLRRRQVGSASGAALPDAPCVSFYQGDAHGGSRVAELAWHASMHPDRGAFADAWVSTAERAAMPPHLGVIVTYVDVRGAWHATTVATQSATQPDQWGYFTTRRMTGGDYIGAMLDTHAPTGPSRYLVKLRNGVRCGARCRPGGAKRANDPRSTGLPANALLYDNGWLAVRPFMPIEPLRPGLSPRQRRRREVLFDYGERYWTQHARHGASLPPVVPRTKQTARRTTGAVAPRRRRTLRGVVLRLRGGGDAAEEGEGGVCCRNCDTLARLHPLPHEDASSLHFAEEDHTYTCWDRVVQRSVTAVIASCFDAFDADAITQKCLPRWAADETSKYYGVIQRVTADGGTAADAAAQIRGEWMERGTQASRLGTEMHRLIEHHLNRTPLPWPAELAAERRQFHAWEQSDVVREHQLQPLRTELTVAWVAGDMVVTAGQIDSIWIDRHGRLYMIDWKRSRKPLLAHASASYGRFGSGPLAHVPDSAYFRYALQQNLYALLLEQRHGLRCDGGLYLLRLHAELGTAYEMVQCPDMRTEAMALLELEHARLLAESTAAVDAGVSASRSPPPRAAVAALVLDVETADWLEQEPAARRAARRARGDLTEQCRGHQHVGVFGHVAWHQSWEAESDRVVQLGWCTLDADGAILERCEVMVSDVPGGVAPKATAYHGITNEMLAESGMPLASALAHLSGALCALEADGGVLVGHHLTFDAGILLHEYGRAGDHGGAQRLARLATAGRCTMNMARSAQTLPIKVHRPSMEWVCVVGVIRPFGDTISPTFQGARERTRRCQRSARYRP